MVTHRAQASTVDVAHRYEDGGGRSLVYVSMSRARQTSTVHVVADNLDQAIEDLTRDWNVDHRARWAIDSGTPATEPLAVEHHPDAPGGQQAALRYARLEAERRAVAAAIPPDPSGELWAAQRRLAELRQDRTDLRTGDGRYAGTPEGDAARRLIDARSRHHEADRLAETSDGWRIRRHWNKEVALWADREGDAKTVYHEIVGPEANRIEREIHSLESLRDELETAKQDRSVWVEQHPEAAFRLHSLDRELHPVVELPDNRPTLGRARGTAHEHDLGIAPPGPDRGIDLGL